MLAERRGKVRYILNPKKCNWSSDDTNFGRRLMQQMGWSDGKGLGREEQGLANPIKVSYKNDTKGMGYKGAPGTSIQQQEEFSQLLAQLNQSEETVIPEPSAVLPASLEKRSESFRSRLHYQKFTRGKDLSRYSEKDLACIVGTGKTKKSVEDQSPVVVKKVEEVNETSFSIPTTNGGFINDYFKQKMQTLKLGKHLLGKKETNDDIVFLENEDEQNTNQNCDDLEETEKLNNYKKDRKDIRHKNNTKKSKRKNKKQKNVEIETNLKEFDHANSNENNDINIDVDVENFIKCKRKKNKTQKKKCDDASDIHSSTNENEVLNCKKYKKRRTSEDATEISSKKIKKQKLQL